LDFCKISHKRSRRELPENAGRVSCPLNLGEISVWVAKIGQQGHGEALKGPQENFKSWTRGECLAVPGQSSSTLKKKKSRGNSKRKKTKLCAGEVANLRKRLSWSGRGQKDKERRVSGEIRVINELYAWLGVGTSVVQLRRSGETIR